MNNSLTRFFARQDINTKRQINFDYLKTFSIICMILIHTLMFPSYAGLTTTPFGIAVNMYLGDFMAGPAFMVVMGVGLAFSKHDSPNQIIKRGIKIFILAYVLNILRGIGLLSIDLTIGKDPLLTSIHAIFGGDILHFAGLALILFGLLKKIKHYKIIVPIVGLVFSLIITCVPHVDTNNLALCVTVALFFPIGYCGGEAISCFPLMSWFIFVAFGYTFGLIVHKVKNLNRFYLFCLLIGIVLFVPIITTELVFNYGLLATNATEMEGYMYIFPDVVMTIGFDLMAFTIFYFLAKIMPEKFNNGVYRVANVVNEIYIISWIMITNISYPIIQFAIKGSNTNIAAYMVAFIIVLVLSTIAGIYWKKLKDKWKLAHSKKTY